MLHHLRRLESKKVISPPNWLCDNIHYITQMGSHAYGTNTKDSDVDYYGFCIPPKRYIFPYTTTENIFGFGPGPQSFNQWQEHHIIDEDSKKEYDVTIYNITSYFHLCMEGNPNMIDSLFTSRECVAHSTQVANLVRDNAVLFLSKKCYHTFRGYAMAQLHKIKSKNPIGKRKELVDIWGYDCKYASHLVRLLEEAIQIFEEGYLDLRKNNELVKAVKRGDWKEEEVYAYFESKSRYLDQLYQKSSLPNTPRIEEIKQLLLKCLEQHYGSLSADITNIDKYEVAINKINDILKDLK